MVTLFYFIKYFPLDYTNRSLVDDCKYLNVCMHTRTCVSRSLALYVCMYVVFMYTLARHLIAYVN